MLEETKRMLIEEDMVDNNDSDDDRMDFMSARDEEVTDKLLRSYRIK